MNKNLNPNHRECKCGETMIQWGDGLPCKINPKTGSKEAGIVWRCYCGITIPADPYVIKTDDEAFNKEWRNANMLDTSRT